MHLNMLPIQYRRRQVIKRRLKQWSSVWAMALTLALTLGGYQAADCRRVSSHLDLLEARYGRIKDTQNRLKAARTELRDMEQREAVVLQLSQRRPMLSLLGGLSQAAKKCEGNVSVAHINWTANGDGPGEPSEQDALQPLLTLEGVGVNNLWVAQFAAALKESEILREVRLKSTEQLPVNGIAAQQYQLECAVY